MSFWQKKLISKRGEAIIRNVCAVASALAGIFFVLIFVGLCIEGVHEHFSVCALVAIPIFVFFATFAFYYSLNLWREYWSAQSVIAELKAFNFHSIEFYDIATHYFRRRLRVIQICGSFFIVMAMLCLVILFTERENWLFDLKFCAFSLFGAVIGWTPYRIGKYGIQMIDAARKADGQHQLNALRQLAKGSFRGDPVGAFVLQCFGDDAAAF